jgi:hypothetical protein
MTRPLDFPTLAAARDDVGLPADCEAPMAPMARHICLPLYRAADGKQALCWCGRDCRDDMLRENNVVRLDWYRSIKQWRP